MNFASGVVKAGNLQIFLSSILEEKELYPAWFIKMVQEHGFVHWKPPIYQSYLPEEIQVQQNYIQSVLGNTNKPENTVGQRILSDIYSKAYTRFLIKHPEIILDKCLKSYSMFWEPIRNYSNLFMGLLFVDPKIRKPFNIVSSLKEISREGIFDNQYVMKGNVLSKTGKNTCFFTLPYIPMYVYIANILIIHILTPLTAIYEIVLCFHNYLKKKHRISDIPERDRILFFFLIVCYIYVAATMNLPEYGENMRFRLSMEPMIWLLSILSITMLFRHMRSYSRRRGLRSEHTEAATQP